MSAQSSQTGRRVLRVLAAVANYQPIGSRALARILNDDKSAIHRALVTLADEGWLQRSDEKAGQWEVSPRILSVADKVYGGYDLKERARPILEKLSDDCGETVTLITPDAGSLVIADVVECRHVLRVVPPIGVPVMIDTSAAGRAILALLDPVAQTERLGRPADPALLNIYAITRECGYAISERQTDLGATALAAAVIEYDGSPCGAVSVIGPYDRLNQERFATIAPLVVRAARALSRGVNPKGIRLFERARY